MNTRDQSGLAGRGGGGGCCRSIPGTKAGAATDCNAWLGWLNGYNQTVGSLEVLHQVTGDEPVRAVWADHLRGTSAYTFGSSSWGGCKCGVCIGTRCGIGGW